MSSDESGVAQGSSLVPLTPIHSGGNLFNSVDRRIVNFYLKQGVTIGQFVNGFGAVGEGAEVWYNLGEWPSLDSFKLLAGHSTRLGYVARTFAYYATMRYR